MLLFCTNFSTFFLTAGQVPAKASLPLMAGQLPAGYTVRRAGDCPAAAQSRLRVPFRPVPAEDVSPAVFPTADHAGRKGQFTAPRLSGEFTRATALAANSNVRHFDISQTSKRRPMKPFVSPQKTFASRMNLRRNTPKQVLGEFSACA
jgi:hypothetical protein